MNSTSFISRRARRALVGAVATIAVSAGSAAIASPSTQAALGDSVSVAVYCNSATHQSRVAYGSIQWGGASHVAFRSAGYNRSTGSWGAWSGWGPGQLTNRSVWSGVQNRGIGAWSFAFQYRLYHPGVGWGQPATVYPRYFQGTSSAFPLTFGAPASFCRT